MVTGMVCQGCRENRHCNEIPAPGAWCDCAHEPRKEAHDETGTPPVHVPAE